MTIDDITEDEFRVYERVRVSGQTNMFDAARVADLAGFSREKVLLIMEHYHELRDKYPGVRQEYKNEVRDA